LLFSYRKYKSFSINYKKSIQIHFYDEVFHIDALKLVYPVCKDKIFLRKTEEKNIFFYQKENLSLR
ncbi:MAG: hypothetical protein II852_16730, partial [Bacteroidales bacterium]|nr:hypothetical protein [Bacteroidales bacterium]